MKSLSRKSLIIIICAVLAVAGLITAVVLLAGNSNKLNGTVTGLEDAMQEIDEYIIDWDSSEKEHEGSSSHVKCSIFVDDFTVFYDDFNEGWIAATTKYKNEGDLVFTFYDDWVADENGVFGEDGDDGDSYINGSGGLLIKNWDDKITIDFNGYKIDRNLTGGIENYGSVIKVDESKVYFKNGCITGGSNLDDGGGVLIYGKYNTHFDNMTVTGNISGNNGGGVYIGSHAEAYFNDTYIEGNYAENYGGGVYADYKVDNYSWAASMEDVVTIQYNIASDNRNNFTFCAKSNDECARIFNAKLKKGSSIYVSLSRKDNVSRAIMDFDNFKSTDLKYFHADDSDYKIYLENDYYYGVAICKRKDENVLNVGDINQIIEDDIVDWNSSVKSHKNGPSDAKCSVTVGDETTTYDDFNEGWIAATTTYKNKGDLVFTLYDDWIGDEDGNLGEDGTDEDSYINGYGGLLIKDWDDKITIDFNGYKIDRNLTDKSVDYGSVIKVDESKAYFKNGCITGGANTSDGGGVLIYGSESAHFENMTVTGNMTGNNGGGVYVGSYSGAYFNNTAIEGNYAENYGGGTYADYKNEFHAAYIDVENIVTIQNNTGYDNRNNLTLCVGDTYYCASLNEPDICEGSNIYVSLTSEKDKYGRTIGCVSGLSDNEISNYFHVDDSDYYFYTDIATNGSSWLVLHSK